MPIPLIAAAGVAAAQNPAVRKLVIGLIVGALVGVPLVIMLIAASILGSGTSVNSALVNAGMNQFCITAAQGAMAQAGAGKYRSGMTGLRLMQFLQAKGLNYQQARIAWSLGMRESGGTNYTSATPGFNGADYGIWQINAPSHGAFIEDKWGWSMNDVGADPEKSFTVMMWFSQRLRNPVIWGLARNQPADAVQFDWRKYSLDWRDRFQSTAEANYIKFYNQFPDAVRQAKVKFPGQPVLFTVPAPGQRRPAPTGTPPPGPVASDPLAGVGSAGQQRALLLSATQPIIDAREEPAGSTLTLEGHTAVPQGSSDLETFTVAGRTWTVYRPYTPLFRSFLMDWQASPALGGGRFNLRAGESTSYYWKREASGRLSDHAGYAVDVRVDALPRLQTQMTAAERAAVRELLQRYPQLGWGGDYRVAARDEAHFFVRAGVSPEGVQELKQTTLFFTDESMEPALGEEGPLVTTLANYPFEVVSKRNWAIPDALAAMRAHPIRRQETGEAAAFVLSLGAKESQIGKKEEEENARRLAKDPNAELLPVPLQDPALMDQWIARAVGLAAGKPVIWITPTVPGPSRKIVLAALDKAKAGYPNLQVISVDASPGAGLVTASGSLTRKGVDEVLSRVSQAVQDAQPLYALKSECQALLFDRSGEAILTGEFRDRTDVVIPGGLEAAARLHSWIGVERAPCSTGPRCINQCDHLTARAQGYSNSNYESARAHWAWAVAGGGRYGVAYPGDVAIPIGGLVFFDTGGDSGHVATYVGGGYVINNSTGSLGAGVYKEPLEDVAKRFRYLGWATPVFPGPGPGFP